MDRDTSRILQLLVNQWSEVTGALERISPGANVLPRDGWTHIRAVAASAEGLVKFELDPVVFNVPERANHSRASLFVVVYGWLEVYRKDFTNNAGLVTHAFSTRAAYFRRQGDKLDHVYGAHYDVSIDELGHPAFHAQLRSFAELHSHVRDQYNMGNAVNDCMNGVLQNVRLPTAQMDFFSVILQLFADHLLFGQSGLEEKCTFNSLLDKSQFLRGAAARSVRLSAEVVRTCFRARHWYPIVT